MYFKGVDDAGSLRCNSNMQENINASVNGELERINLEIRCSVRMLEDMMEM